VSLAGFIVTTELRSLMHHHLKDAQEPSCTLIPIEHGLIEVSGDPGG
jgi:hypothetical protein